MHNHNDNDKGMKSMMWMMVICCAVPIVLILFLGAGGKAIGAPTWVILGAVALMVAAHLFMMRKSHKNPDDEQAATGPEDKDKDGKDNKDHSDHGCCH